MYQNVRYECHRITKSDQPDSGLKTGKLKITSTVNYAEREKKTCLQNAELTWH